MLIDGDERQQRGPRHTGGVDDEQVQPESLAEWRAWLAENHDRGAGVWLVMRRASAGGPRISYEESVEQALCFGWVDGHAVARDDESYYLRFTPRQPASTWSAVNRERAERLIATGQMTPAGQAMVDLAKRTGSWDPFPDADAGLLPADLADAFAADPTAAQYFDAFPPSSRRLILRWIAEAKRPETRAKRVTETVELARHNIRAHHSR